MDDRQRQWGINQWAAFFETRRLPIMERSKQRVLALDEQEGDALSAHELALVVQDDPLLCLQLLREAERLRTRRLGNETTTTLQAVMQLGVDKVKRLLLESEEVDPSNTGLCFVESRSALAAGIALRWASGRSDMRPGELALAALLSDIGEILLWLYAPELAQAALDELRSGRATRSNQAQQQVCGFSFKALTVRCAELWNLPDLLLKLLQGAESERALLIRACTNFSRHLTHRDEHAELALASDLVDARRLMPHVSYEWLLSAVEGIDWLADEGERQALLALAESLSGDAAAGVAAGAAAPADGSAASPGS